MLQGSSRRRQPDKIDLVVKMYTLSEIEVVMQWNYSTCCTVQIRRGAYNIPPSCTRTGDAAIQVPATGYVRERKSFG